MKISQARDITLKLKPPEYMKCKIKTLHILRYSLILILCLGFNLLFGGNTPCSPTPLSTFSTEYLLFDNTSNTDSGVPAPEIGGYSGSDIWFSFIMPNNDVTLILEHGGMVDPALAIYAGNCNNLLLNYNVIDNNCNGSVDPEILISDLTPGETYLIRVWAQDGSANGTFEVFLGNDVPSIIGFDAFDDATIQGDCIQLTPASGFKIGCAWYQIQIDFSKPFSHEMSANFGTNNSFGADGLCLVYQANGPEYCGNTGGGMGAEGMPNSAIFEFDTFQNHFPYNDPVADHVSFNVNGDMTHPNSINGPISLLYNIENGTDHNILFNWNPDGNLYELYFDGTIILSGSYDIINNCFGGNNFAYWGYTAATGSLKNKHTICPLKAEYTPSTVTYEEISICQGGEYHGWSESGFYIRKEIGNNECINQIHTLLTIEDELKSSSLEKSICKGETYEIEGNLYTDEGLYTIQTQTLLGCDSTIYLDLKVVVPSIEILGAQDFTCSTNAIILSLDYDENYSITNEDIFWQTPNGSPQAESIIATSPGTYTVNTIINYDNLHCQVESGIELFIDTIAPLIDTVSDFTILCDTPLEDKILIAPNNTNNLDFKWYLNNILVGIGDSLPISLVGSYTLIAEDTLNGCTSIDSIQVIDLSQPPTLTFEAETITCNTPSVVLDLNITSAYQTVTWTYPDASINTEVAPTITDVGIYHLHVDGGSCEIDTFFEILIDTISPSYSLEYGSIDCNTNNTFLNIINDQNIESIIIISPSNQVYTELENSISEEGFYTISTIGSNGCPTDETIEVQSFVTLPEVIIEHDSIISCNEPMASIIAYSNNENLNYTWINDEISIIGNTNSISVNNEGTYLLNIMDEYGCTNMYSINIDEKLAKPEINLSADIITCTFETSTIILESEDTLTETIWSDTNGIIATTPQLETNHIGWYFAQITNYYGCTSIDSILVIENIDQPDISLSADIITCDYETSTIILESEDTLIDTIWSDANGIIATTPYLVTSEIGWYFAEVINDNGCISKDSILVVENIESPILELLSNDTLLLTPNESTTVNIAELTSGNVTYEWIPTEGLSCWDCLEPSITDYIHESYHLTVTHENGCQSTLAVSVKDSRPAEVYIPNIFSPSTEDGNNDFFTLYGNENIDYINDMIIFDRWGNQIFSNGNFPPNDPNLGWNGLYKGNSITNGVYTYIFKVTTHKGEILTFTGMITKV